MKFWRQAQSTDTPDQLENRMGPKTGDKLGWETSQEGEHSIPDQMGDKLGPETKKRQAQGGRHSIPDERQATRQNKDKSWETRPETRERQDQGGGQSIPDQMGDKLGDKTGDSPARRTQHPSQDGRQDRRQDRRQEMTHVSKSLWITVTPHRTCSRPKMACERTNTIQPLILKVWQDQGGPSMVTRASVLPGGTFRFPNTCSLEFPKEIELVFNHPCGLLFNYLLSA